jgi:hypothetical protein
LNGLIIKHYAHHVDTSTDTSLNRVRVVSVGRCGNPIDAFPVGNHETLFERKGKKGLKL